MSEHQARIPARRKVLALALSAAAAASVLAVNASSAAGLPEHQARSADSFVDSIGVATHLTYTDTPYATKNYPLIKQRLQESGIRHIRDGWGTGSKYASDFVEKELHPSGIGVTMVHDPSLNATPAQLKEMVKSQLPNSIDAVESINEPDNRSGFPSLPQSWTRQLAETYNADPATRDIPLIAPALAQTIRSEPYRAMGNLSAYVDYGNAHDYPGDQFTMNDSILKAVKDNNAITAPGKPIVVTETGYSNGTVNALHPATPEAQAAQSLPRLFLDHYRGGIARTFSYELIDEHPDQQFESRFGLLRNDLSPKPAFTAVANMNAILSDKGATFSPKPLAYELSGETSTTRTLLLQKRDGTYYLVAWQQDPTWNGRQVINPPDARLTLKLPSTAQVQTYDLKSRSPKSTQSGSTITFTSSEDVTILALKGLNGSTSPVTPPPTTPPVTTPPPTTPPTTPPVTTPPATPGTSYQVDAGSTTDKFFDGGQVATSSTGAGALYDTVRWGMRGYSFPVPNGTYEVTVNTVENAFSAPGQRVFSITGEGQTLVRDLDIYSRVGKDKPLNLTYKVNVTDGVLNLGFAATKDNAVIAGLSVRQLSAPTASPQPREYRIDSGSSTLVKADATTTYDADKYYQGGQANTTKLNVTQGANYGVLYDTVRWGLKGYDLPLQNGTYDVKIRTVENAFSASGQRVFSITGEGKTLVKDLDIYSRVGKDKPFDLTYRVTVTDGSLNLGFAAVRDNPVVAGIAVTPAA